MRALTSKDYKLTRVGNLDLHRTLPIQRKLRRFVENADGSVRCKAYQRGWLELSIAFKVGQNFIGSY